MKYEDVQSKIITHLNTTHFCTLATANKDGVVCACQMCLVNDGLKVYIQTDKTYEKIKNITENPNVAITCGAYYFKGNANLLGHPTENEWFVNAIKEKHPKTYNRYTNLPNEVLISINLTECKIWGFDNGNKTPNQEVLLVVDLINKTTKEIICERM